MSVRGLAVLLVLWAVPASAADVYVSNSGSDANSCATAESATAANAKKTISNALANCITAGEALIIHGGTYTGAANTIDTQTYTVPAGTSFANAVTVKAKSGETVILKPPYNTAAIRLNGSSYQYLIFQDFEVDASNSTAGSDSVGIFAHDASYIRYERLTVHHSWNFGFSISVTSHHNEILDNYIHTNGNPAGDSTNGHGIYITGCDNTIRGNRITNNYGYGIHMYNNAGSHDCPSRNVVERNELSFNGIRGPLVTAYGIVISWGADNVIRNNLIFRNNGGIQDYTESTSTLIYNNTVVFNGAFGGIVSQYYTVRASIRQNIAYGNGSPGDIYDYGSSGTTANNVTTDPGFTDSGNNDFTLTGSVATAIDIAACLSGVTVDYVGASRPAGSRCDAGAYEYGGAGVVPPRITTLTLSGGQVDQVFSQQVCGADGQTNYTFTVSAGSLPTGITLSSATPCATLSGTPSAANTFAFTILLTDADMATDTQAFSVTIIAAPTATCSGGEGAWALITDTCVGASSSNGTAAATTAGVNTTGAAFGVCVIADDKSVAATPLTDSKSNTWTLVGSAVTSEFGRIRIFYSRYGSVGAAHTFTADPAGASAFPAIQCMSWAQSATSPLGVVAPGGAATAALAVQAGSVTTSQTYQLIVAALEAEDANTVDATGYTVYQRTYSLDKAFGVALAWKVAPTTTSTVPAWSCASPMSMATASAAFFVSDISSAPTPRIRGW